jgi:pyruvate kinase
MKYSATKIVATLGPASSNPKMIAELIKTGVNIFRLNFSHGDFQAHQARLDLIRETSRKVGIQVGIMQDLPGPKIRIGEIPKMILKRGERIILNSSPGKSTIDIPVQCAGLHKDVKSGTTIYLNDGAIRLRVLKVSGSRVFCQIEIGGPLSSHKGLNLPGTRISTPSLTVFDKTCVKFGIENKVDFIAMSFVRSASDIESLRKLIKLHGGRQFIIAKIEKKEAIIDFKNILAKTDGVMVARGDLGIEVPIEEVPGIQKTLIRKCNQAGVPVITATQVLESMITSPRPTRAEATDAANAVLDGTDALMLSGETAVGSFPIEAVQTLKAVCAETEKHLRPRFPARADEIGDIEIAACLARSVCESALQLGVKIIATPTRSGHTARLISRFKPNARIVAFSENEFTRAQLLLSWGVQPIEIDQSLTFDKLILKIKQGLLKCQTAKKGESIIITAGSPGSSAGQTNLMVIETL